MKKGKFVDILGPMGSGKGTLIEHLRKTFPELVFPKSKTTRKQRPNDDKASVYDFISEKEFQRMIDEGEFLEWAESSGTGTRYGTPLASVREAIDSGKIAVKEVEVQGARQLQQKLSEDELVTIFIFGGSWEDMVERARTRNPESDELKEAYLSKRKERFDDEMTFLPEADFVVENKNGELEKAKKDLEEIIRSFLV